MGPGKGTDHWRCRGQPLARSAQACPLDAVTQVRGRLENMDIHMRIYSSAILVLAFVLGNIGLAVAEDKSVADLIPELSGDKPMAQRTVAQLAKDYTIIIDSLLSDLGNEDAAKRSGAQRTLERLAFNASRPDAERERFACSSAIASRLGPDVSPLASVWLLRQLERIGRAECVASIARLLDDKDELIRESARRALAKNPSREANQAIQT